ncbi:MAG: VapC toxin family PIN domain ribonuclease [Alphaproteobacteria bacterium]|nr:MAG: VapC toxin family PIN domain ribonuclease [Alphaproteobacteria bacterium]PZO35970.1 MAG: VapC toxin family PIN domain ribonuclease [Alphaproteobacteria bacterium]
MIAIDTNVVVRILVADSPEQTDRAKALVRHTPVWVSTTVVLEAAWVLSSRYGFSPTMVADALTSLGGLPGVTFEKAEAIHRAFDAVRAGLDFADAIHLALASDQTAFATFDKELAGRAAAWELGLGDVILL